VWCHSWCTDNESPRKQDDVRIKNAAKKVSEKYRKKRLTRNLTNLGGLFQVPSLLRILNPRREREHQIRKKNNEKIQIKSVLPTFEVVAKKLRRETVFGKNTSDCSDVARRRQQIWYSPTFAL
jgi:hypothetical protein